MRGFSVFAAFVGTVMIIIALILGVTFIQNHITMNKMVVNMKHDIELYDAIQETRALVFSNINYLMLIELKNKIDTDPMHIYICNNAKKCMDRVMDYIQGIKNYAKSGATTAVINKIKQMIISRGVTPISLTNPTSKIVTELKWNSSGTYIVLNKSDITAKFEYQGKIIDVVISPPKNHTYKLPWDFVHVLNQTGNITGALLDKLEKGRAYVKASCYCDCWRECDDDSCWWVCVAKDKYVKGNLLKIRNPYGGYLKDNFLEESFSNHGCEALRSFRTVNEAKEDLKEYLNESLKDIFDQFRVNAKITVEIVNYTEEVLNHPNDNVGISSPITDGTCYSYKNEYLNRILKINKIRVKYELKMKAECSSTGEPELNPKIGFTNG